MKLLIAVEGNTLKNIVADRFERAAWYLIIDDRCTRISTIENLGPRTREDVIALASKEGVTAVLSGAFGLRMCNLLRLSNVKIAFAPRITVLEAVKRLKKGLLTLLEPASFQKTVFDRIVNRKERQRIFLEKELRGTVKRTPRSATPCQRYSVPVFAGR